MRCFVAIDLSEAVREAVVRAQRDLARAGHGADVRWVGPAGMHLTLKFLGEVDEHDRDAVAAALGEVAAPFSPFTLAARGLGGFPTDRRPRVVWVGVGGAADTLARLAAAVDQALAPLGFPPETRPFVGHVTLGRVRSPRQLDRLAVALAAAAALDLGAWTVREIVLYQSRLRPGGAVYDPLAHVPFGSRNA